MAPEIARALFEVFPDAEAEIGSPAHAGIRFLLVGDDPEKALAELEASVEALLKSGDLDELQKLTWVLIDSPYRALGALFARSLLPIAEEKMVPGLFDGVLAVRAKLNLSPDDEFSDWMDARAARQPKSDESEPLLEAQAKLERKAAEVRQVQERLVALQREIALREKREHRTAAELPMAPTADPTALRELRGKVGELKSLLHERGDERVTLRREVEKLHHDVETLRSANAASHPREEDDGGRTLEIVGQQPVRPLAFPKDFRRTLAKFKPHVARAAMNRLGQLAAGEAGAFEKLKAIVALPGVVEARISDRYRLLFSLLPTCVRVVDLIYRPELDKAIERFKITGLPSVPEFE